MARLTKFFHLSPADQWLALETWLLLGLARFAVLSLPFRWIAARLGTENESAIETKDLSSPQIDRISWAVQKMSRFTPWRSNCLAQSIAGKYMLRRRRISSTLYFGLTKGPAGEFEGHAWLTAGGVILTGDSDLERYAVVAKFTD